MTARNASKRGSNAKRRRGARQKAMQALYQWDFDQAANPPAHVISQFCDMQNMDKVDIDYFESLFNYSVENVEEVDAEISRHLDRELAHLDPIERSVLRICCTELKTQLGTPYKVVVNEALEISKDFGADKGYRYINGIADKLAAALRSTEYVADHPSGNPLSEQSAVREPTRKSQGSAVKISIKEKSDEPGAAAGKTQGAPRIKASGKASGKSSGKSSGKPATRSSVSPRGRSCGESDKSSEAKTVGDAKPASRGDSDRKKH